MNSPVNANHAAEFGFAHARQTSHANFFVAINFHADDYITVWLTLSVLLFILNAGGEIFGLEDETLPRLDRLDSQAARS